uniref:7TM_GPCR_Srx domain-containing protein n=1 Tax=Bursaphelenchus xylophilus TaxID=6326 RepID=A0A1I7S9G0_BURXY
MASSSSDSTDFVDDIPELRRVLSVVGFVLGLESIAVNVFAIWFLCRTSPLRNFNAALTVLKIALDIPTALVWTFWWLPWSFAAESSRTEDQDPWCLPRAYMGIDIALYFVVVSSFHLSLYAQVHIILARFFGVFYGFLFQRIYRKQYIVIGALITVFIVFNRVAVESLYIQCVAEYSPSFFVFLGAPMDDLGKDCDTPKFLYPLLITHFWIVVGICLVVALVTVVKLRLLNREQSKLAHISEPVKSHRRSAEWKLLIISVTTPVLLSIQVVAIMETDWTINEKRTIGTIAILSYVLNCIAELIVIQSFAIVQLLINQSFWRWIKCQPIEVAQCSTKTLISAKNSS